MDFSQINDALFIGTTPTLDDYERLRRLGIQLIINMRLGHRVRPNPSNPPLEYLWLRTFDNPLLPIPMVKLARGVQAALRIIGSGGKVYAHCARGRHRSVAMGAAILIAQGYTPGMAVHLIKQQRPASDPDVFYIRRRILLFERYWQTHCRQI